MVNEAKPQGWPNTERAIREAFRKDGHEVTWLQVGNYLASIKHWQAAEWAYGQTPEEER